MFSSYWRFVELILHFHWHHFSFSFAIALNFCFVNPIQCNSISLHRITFILLRRTNYNHDFIFILKRSFFSLSLVAFRFVFLPNVDLQIVCLFTCLLPMSLLLVTEEPKIEIGSLCVYVCFFFMTIFMDSIRVVKAFAYIERNLNSTRRHNVWTSSCSRDEFTLLTANTTLCRTLHSYGKRVYFFCNLFFLHLHLLCSLFVNKWLFFHLCFFFQFNPNTE